MIALIDQSKMNKYVSPFVLIAFVLLSCNEGKNQIENSHSQVEKNDVLLEVAKQGIFLNKMKIKTFTDLADINDILGNPLKENIPSPSKIQEVEEKFGTKPNNIFTYSDNGIIVYQDVDNKDIKNISVHFVLQDFDFSPSKTFGGELKINGYKINSGTTLNDLREIPELEVSETFVNVHNASFNNHPLTFTFISNEDKSGLTGVSIGINNIQQKTNEKGWSDKDIEILKAGTANVEQIKALSIQYNFKLSDFVDCYISKVVTTTTFNEMENPTNELQQKIVKIIEDCIAQTSK